MSINSLDLALSANEELKFYSSLDTEMTDVSKNIFDF